MAKFNFVVCGGTFDLLHAGHKTFIQNALKTSEKVLLGITDDSYIQNSKNNLGIEDFQTRKFAVEQYLNSLGVTNRVQVVGISNAYEPYLETSADYQAIVVTEQTEKAALEINAKRKQNNIPQLQVIISEMKKAQDGKEISSTRIRNGEINREGRMYLNPEWQNKKLILPDKLRSKLQEPWGRVLNEIPSNLDGTKTVVVGDATSQRFNQKSIKRFLSIVDFQIQRKVSFQNLLELGFANEEVRKINNPHGELTPELFGAVQLAFESQNKTVILVEGEDDLAVLPVLLISPLGFEIFYGQPNVGLVQLPVTEENKEKAYQLVQHFDKS
jgi:cytidyltransferase-like protein